MKNKLRSITAFFLACVLVVFLSACSLSGQSQSGNSASPVSSSQEDAANSKTGGILTEKEALKLIKEQVLKDYENEETTVEKDSGQILDQNEVAYIIGYDISDKVSGNHLYTEAYWINKKTMKIKDVCSINEYYEGLIDVTEGESNF